MPGTGKNKLSYASKEACIADAKSKGMNLKLCNNLPSNQTKRLKPSGEMMTKATMPKGGGGGMGY